MAIVIIDARDLDTDGYRFDIDLFSERTDIPERWKYLTKKVPSFANGALPGESLAQYRARIMATLSEISRGVRRARIAAYREDGVIMPGLIGTEL